MKAETLEALRTGLDRRGFDLVYVDDPDWTTERARKLLNCFAVAQDALIRIVASTGVGETYWIAMRALEEIKQVADAD